MKYASELKKSDVRGKRFLVRVDLNIKNSDELFRLDAVIPTLSLLLKKEAKKIIIVSHRGRPGSAKRTISKKMKEVSLEAFAPLIAGKTGEAVDFISANRIATLVREVENSDARIVLVENIRLFSGEEANDPSFGRILASCADAYVNDAFASSHRAHASISAITKFLPSYAGILLEREMTRLDAMLRNPRRPFVLVVGGAKISDKLGIVRMFQNDADKILVGGAAANTCLVAQGFPVWRSLYEPKMVREARKIQKKNVFLPVDAHVFEEAILDIGPETARFFAEAIALAKTIVWSGPMGLSEKRGFEKGTRAIWSAILANKDAEVVVGGGETIASAKLIPNFKSKISKRKNIFLSTGGGAMLDYLGGKKLPGIEVLKKQKNRK